MNIKILSLCEKGLKRDVNQDSIFFQSNGDVAIAVVADGMGGHQGGEKASQHSVSSIQAWFESNQNNLLIWNDEFLIDNMKVFIKSINDYLYKLFEDNGYKGGTTLTVFLIVREIYHIYHIGDSRIYLIRNKEMKSLTEDDLWENLPSIQKQYTHLERMQSVHQGKLTQAVGFDQHIQIHHSSGDIHSKDTFLLCSDGVYKYVKEDYISKALSSGFRNKVDSKKIKKLDQEIVRNGAGDNYSAIFCVVNR